MRMSRPIAAIDFRLLFLHCGSPNLPFIDGAKLRLFDRQFHIELGDVVIG
jgi:hypothetical protein